LQSSPTSLDALTMFGLLDSYRGRYDHAIQALRRVSGLSPEYSPARYYLANVLLDAGYHVAALETLLALVKEDGSKHVLASLGRAYAKNGKKARARAVLHELSLESGADFSSPYLKCGIQLALGEHRAARASLKEMIESKDPWALFVQVEPRFSDLM
jgi:predicted Zn-dependent protease